jgi:hypothetical protein
MAYVASALQELGDGELCMPDLEATRDGFNGQASHSASHPFVVSLAEC